MRGMMLVNATSLSGVNNKVAVQLREVAALLEQQQANPFRVAAYRHAADTVDSLPQDLDQLVAAGGVDALVALPAIGLGIARSILEILSGRPWRLLQRLRGGTEPEKLFQTIPTVGPALARAIHETLHVDSLEALEVAAHDGRILTVPGFGPRRAELLRASLAQRLGTRLRPLHSSPHDGPTVDVLLDLDREYRRRASDGRLPTIAPKRFNPLGRSWLPILHTERGDWHFTALFSNTARAHQLGRTRDWVVIYFYDDHHQEGQYTVVTETHGVLSRKRVVRGREAECRLFYQRLEATAEPTETLPMECEETTGSRARR